MLDQKHKYRDRLGESLLLVKIDYLEILTLAQMEVPMNTATYKDLAEIYLVSILIKIIPNSYFSNEKNPNFPGSNISL